MKIITNKKLKHLLSEAFAKGVMRGVELGYALGKMDVTKMGCILLGTRADEEIEQILKEKGM